MPTVCVAALQVPPPQLPILIVGDEVLIMESLRASLESDGHRVTTATGGQAGIDAFDAAILGSTPFALVITDLEMPYVDGRTVAAAIKVVSPATSVILLADWWQHLIDDKDIPAHVDRVLGKLPELCDLRRVLADLASNPL